MASGLGLPGSLFHSGDFRLLKLIPGRILCMTKWSPDIIFPALLLGRKVVLTHS